MIQRNPIQIPPNYHPVQRPNLIQRPPPTLRNMNPQPLPTDRNRIYQKQPGQIIINN